MSDHPAFTIKTENDRTFLYCHGAWRTEKLDKIEKALKKNWHRLFQREVVVDVSAIERIDTGGMILFLRLRERLKKTGHCHIVGADRDFCKMFKLVSRHRRPLVSDVSPVWTILTDALVDLGKATHRAWRDFILFLNFLGAVTLAMGRSLLDPSRIRYKEISSHLYKAGVTALPIVALSAFLVGVVIAYQSAVQLQKYGANVFIVDMIGISIPRELAPLITAIIVAGRSGSSYTAQIGVMKITEEIDAMKTMGFEIFRFVVLPRILAMIVSLPLLIFFADIVGIYAGMLVAKAQLNITPGQFLERLQHAVDVRHYLVGLFKAPFFAFIVAAIGCFRGFQVAGNTESIGHYTTMSVVNAIFIVVAVDALFSVIFTELGI